MYFQNEIIAVEALGIYEIFCSTLYTFVPSICRFAELQNNCNYLFPAIFRFMLHTVQRQSLILYYIFLRVFLLLYHQQNPTS